MDDLEDEEEEAFLNQYRQKRLAELSALQKSSVYGQVYPLQKPDYAKEVTEASSNAFVLVNLTSSMGNNVESRLLTELWRQLAVKYGDVKFCEIRAEMCIEGYPEKNTPTVLIYRNGDIKRQLVTLGELGGVKTKLGDVEEILVQVGAITESDVRLKRVDDDEEDRPGGRMETREDNDDDWE